MYIELVRDNIAIVHALNDRDILFAIKNLKATHNQNILMFFCSLCVCQNSAVHSHQNIICKELFENKANAGALYDISFDKAKKSVMIRTDPAQATAKSLSE